MTGNISLDFANTADWHAGPNPEERLVSYASALDWARAVGILSEAQAESLLRSALADPVGEAEALKRIIALREAVYRIFSAVARQGLPEPHDVELLNVELADASTHLKLVMVPDTHSCGESGGGGRASGEASPKVEAPRQFAWTWTDVENHLTSLLWPVARAATSLLTSPELGRVRECAGDPCGWVFLDLSKNASRRWCDMADCGNRAKARRYRARKKGEADGKETPG